MSTCGALKLMRAHAINWQSCPPQLNCSKSCLPDMPPIAFTCVMKFLDLGATWNGDPRDLIDFNLEAEQCGLHLLYMLKVYSSLPLSKVQHSQQANSKGNKCHVSLVR